MVKVSLVDEFRAQVLRASGFNPWILQFLFYFEKNVITFGEKTFSQFKPLTPLPKILKYFPKKKLIFIIIY
jgi:hypothetical protein